MRQIERRATGGWSVAAASITIALLVWLELSFNQWRLLIVTALLMTAVMLCHRRWRSFVLLPSCIVLLGVLLLVITEVDQRRYQEQGGGVYQEITKQVGAKRGT